MYNVFDLKRWAHYIPSTQNFQNQIRIYEIYEACNKPSHKETMTTVVPVWYHNAYIGAQGDLEYWYVNPLTIYGSRRYAKPAWDRVARARSTSKQRNNEPFRKQTTKTVLKTVHTNQKKVLMSHSSYGSGHLSKFFITCWLLLGTRAQHTPDLGCLMVCDILSYSTVVPGILLKPAWGLLSIIGTILSIIRPTHVQPVCWTRWEATAHGP